MEQQMKPELKPEVAREEEEGKPEAITIDDEEECSANDNKNRPERKASDFWSCCCDCFGVFIDEVFWYMNCYTLWSGCKRDGCCPAWCCSCDCCSGDCCLTDCCSCDGDGSTSEGISADDCCCCFGSDCCSDV